MQHGKHVKVGLRSGIPGSKWIQPTPVYYFPSKDAGHPHFHILVNRIGYDGSVVSDSNDYARSEKVLRDLERKYNLTQVVGSREAKERALSNAP